MSYLLHLWREPLPVSLVQAEALLVDFRLQMVLTPDPLVRLLVEDIAARLPTGHDPDIQAGDARKCLRFVDCCEHQRTAVLVGLEHFVRWSPGFNLGRNHIDASLKGITLVCSTNRNVIALDDYRRRSHCRGLYQLPVAA